MAACTAAVIHDEPTNTRQIATRMLRALSEGDRAGLESGIRRVGVARLHPVSVMEDEQLEILAAIADDLKIRIAEPDTRRVDLEDAAATEVHLSLLRHLVRRSPRAEMRLRAS